MDWKNVKLIFLREMRDQLRDRRTLFLIAVLPLLLYPLLGTSLFQLSQFLRHQAATVLVVGAEQLEGREWMPALIEGDRFAEGLFASPRDRENLQIVDPKEGVPFDDAALEEARGKLSSGDLQVVLVFPEGFGDRLDEARLSLLERASRPVDPSAGELPEPEIYFNSANEGSQVAESRVGRALRTWRSEVMQRNLRDAKVPLDAARPFAVEPRDVAQQRQRQAAVWSKILPFMVFIWALTGAFYPAVDLCAGEKERGTLETLLASPAKRREIVWGKLLTVMTFSIATAVLNLSSMGLTGKFVLQQLQGVTGMGDGLLKMPPLISVVWLGAALVPMAALFSALCLALAAFARSTKEGQYYLMPLLLVTMPLMMLPLSPGVELGLGNALIPVTGVVLLLRSFIEGQYLTAMPYVLPVCGMTLLCCLFAIRWAEEQFNRESVLFRESERLELGRWLMHLVRDRAETPSFAQAVLCVAVILVVQFFVRIAMAAQATGAIDKTFLMQSVFISQAVCILLPAVFLTLLFTRRRKMTLLLDRALSWQSLLAAGVLAVLVRPLGFELVAAIQALYPATGDVAGQLEALSRALMSELSWPTLLLMLAVLPAVCEEVAFRGFILSGFRHVGHKWWAIGLSAAAFGLAHPVLQQQLAAAAVGAVIGYIAVQSGSLWPCMLFHALYNGIAVLLGSEAMLRPETGENLTWLFREPGSATVCQPWVLVLCGAGAVGVGYWFHLLPYQRTRGRDHPGSPRP